MPNREGTTRVEFAIRSEDAELLARVAKLRGTTVAEIVRTALYAQVTPLANAQAERVERSHREVVERQKLSEWNGQKF